MKNTTTLIAITYIIVYVVTVVVAITNTTVMVLPMVCILFASILLLIGYGVVRAVHKARYDRLVEDAESNASLPSDTYDGQ